MNKNHSIFNIDKKEKFIVSDAQEFNNYNEFKNKMLKEPDTFIKEDIENPESKNIVDPDTKKDDALDYTIQMKYVDHINAKPQKDIKEKDKKAYVTASDFGLEAPRQVVSCANSSISQKWRTGKNSILPYKIYCEGPNKIQADDYYKTHYKAQIIPIEDHLVRGHNYGDYSNWVSPYNMEIRILSQATKGINPKNNKYKNLPTAINYAFHNTPAMRMP